MKTFSQQASKVFALVGFIIVATTLFLFYQLRAPTERSETFTFTVWFVVFQEILLFGGFSLTARRSSETDTSVPVQISYVTTILLYNFLAIATILLFNLKLLPDGAAPRTYYTILIAETGLWLALLVMMQIVEIAHRAAHREAELARGNVDQLILQCDRIRAVCKNQDWPLASSMHDLAERIRFSEGLRKNGALIREVTKKLAELERLASNGNDAVAQNSGQQLVHEISTLASRRG